MGANHSCSVSWKLKPQRAFDSQLPWLWEGGTNPATMIGFDADEVEGSTRRGLKAVEMVGFDAEEVGNRKSGTSSYAAKSGTKDEDSKYDTKFPLAEWGMTREDCIDAIRDAGLPVPGKSACVHCPFGQKCEAHAMKQSGELKQVVALEQRFNTAQQRREEENEQVRQTLDDKFENMPQKDLDAEIKDLKARAKDRKLDPDELERYEQLANLKKARRAKFNQGLHRSGRNFADMAEEPMSEKDRSEEGLLADPLPDPVFEGGDPEPAADPHDDLLAKAAPHRQYGENYDRNIATKAARLAQARERGYKPDMLDQLAYELRMALSTKPKPAASEAPPHPLSHHGERVRGDYDRSIGRIDANGGDFRTIRMELIDDHPNPDLHLARLRHIRDKYPEEFEKVKERNQGLRLKFAIDQLEKENDE